MQKDGKAAALTIEAGTMDTLTNGKVEMGGQQMSSSYRYLHKLCQH